MAVDIHSFPFVFEKQRLALAPQKAWQNFNACTIKCCV